MDSECERLDKARVALRLDVVGGMKQRLRHLLGEAGAAATFGFPAVAAAADSLCRLIEYTPDVTRIPHKLVDQHVDAVRAIYREYARSDAIDLAHTLTGRLREVTDEFVIHENQDRPNVLAEIMGPPLAAEL